MEDPIVSPLHPESHRYNIDVMQWRGGGGGREGWFKGLSYCPEALGPLVIRRSHRFSDDCAVMF